MEYLTLLEELRLPHWLIIAGVAFVLFGALGIVLRRPHRDAHSETPEAAPWREGSPLVSPASRRLRPELPTEKEVEERAKALASSRDQ